MKSTIIEVGRTILLCFHRHCSAGADTLTTLQCVDAGVDTGGDVAAADEPAEPGHSVDIVRPSDAKPEA